MSELDLCHLQFYGTNEDTSHVFFGDATSKKFGTYFVKDGKVSEHTRKEGVHMRWTSESEACVTAVDGHRCQGTDIHFSGCLGATQCVHPRLSALSGQASFCHPDTFWILLQRFPEAAGSILQGPNTVTALHTRFHTSVVKQRGGGCSCSGA